MTHEDFVTYEQAVKLKELGFNRECIRFYNISQSPYPLLKRIGEYETEFGDYNNKAQHLYSAPTLSQVQKWLREVKGVDVHYHYGRKKWTYYWGRRWTQALYEEEYDTPLEALYAGIDTVLTFLKEESK